MEIPQNNSYDVIMFESVRRVKTYHNEALEGFSLEAIYG